MNEFRDKSINNRLPRNVFFLGLVSMFTDFSSEVAVRTLPLFLSKSHEVVILNTVFFVFFYVPIIFTEGAFLPQRLSHI